MLAKARAFLNTPLGRKVEHLVLAFVATFAVTLGFNGWHLLHEHGLSALESGLPALAVTALLAAWQKVRGSLPASVVAEVENVVKQRKAKVVKVKPVP